MKTSYKEEGRNRASLPRRLCLALVAALLLTTGFTVRAAEPETGNPRVTIAMNNVAISKVFQAIQSQTEMPVVYNTSDVNPDRQVSIDVSNATVAETMNKLVAGTNIAYTIKNNHIVLTVRATPPHTGAKIQGVSGIVKDAKGEPMIGATVLIQGTMNGTAADAGGRFTLPQAKAGDMLQISLIGYKAVEIPVVDGRELVVVLHEDAEGIETVVVTALGIKKQTKSLTYNVQEIAGDALTGVKDASFVNALSGKVAGVQINASASGVGGSTRVVMRGTKSLFGDNNALYVVDGIPMPSLRTSQDRSVYETADGGDSDGISSLNPEDIESMSVLTGAAAAALYGAQGANGVIVITTKKGKEGKLTVNYSNNTTFMTPFVTPAFQNRYGSPAGEFSSWGPKLATPSSYDPLDFFQTGYNMTNSVSISSGTERSQTYASAAAVNARGIIPNNDYSRYNFTFRNTTELVKDKLTLDVNAQYVRQYDKNQMVQGQYHNPLIPIYLFPRGEDIEKFKVYERYNPALGYDAQFWPYGDQSMGMENPWWITNREVFENQRQRFMIAGTLKWDITEDLTVTGRIREDYSNNIYTKKIHATSDTKFASEYGSYLNNKTSENNLYADVLASYNKRFCEDWDLSVNVGASLSDTKYDMTGIEGYLATVPNVFTPGNIDKADNSTNIIQSRYHDQSQAIYGTLQLGWKGMLYLDLTGRNDWASQLAFTPKMSFAYGSVGLSAVISSMADLSGAGISFLKVRGSYSTVGNPPQRYITREGFPIKNGTIDTQGFFPASDLKPERTKAFEVGLNAKFLGNRINLDVTYYNSNTFNQLFKVNAAASSGYKYFYINSGKVNNWGIEAALGYRDTFGESFHWETNLTYTMNRNKIKELVVNGVKDPTTGAEITMDYFDIAQAGSYLQRLTKGGSMGDVYVTGLKTDFNGHIYADPNTGAIQADNNTWHYAGSTDPKYRLSWNNQFSWKGLNFGFLVDARVGGIVVSPTQAKLDYFGASKASADARDKGGVLINGGPLNAKSYYDVVGAGLTGVLSQYVYSATNVRLREASIGYTLPSKWFRDKLTATVSLVGRNLWMLYNEAPFDPELTASTGTYYQGFDYFMQPALRTVGFSVRLQF